MKYGAEEWTLRDRRKQLYPSSSCWQLKNITCKNRKSNADIFKELEERELFGIAVKKWTYFGSMSRKRNSSITTVIDQGKVEGKRGWGRPKISFMDTTDRDFNPVNFPNHS